MKTLVTGLIILAILPLNLMAQQNEKIKGNKEVSSISEDIKESFTGVEISDNIEVEIANASSNSYVLTADENLLREVGVEVKSGILKIFLKNKIVRSKELQLLLKLRDIQSIVINEDAQLNTAGRLKLDKLELIMNKGSRMQMNLEINDNLELMLVKNAGGKVDIRSKEVSIRMKDRSDLKAKLKKTNTLNVLLENSAVLKLDGEADESEYQVSGGSKLDARKLKSRNVLLESKGKTDLHVRASRKIKVNASGKSKIIIYGNPEVELSEFTDRSRIIKK